MYTYVQIISFTHIQLTNIIKITVVLSNKRKTEMRNQNDPYAHPLLQMIYFLLSPWHMLFLLLSLWQMMVENVTCRAMGVLYGKVM